MQEAKAREGEEEMSGLGKVGGKAAGGWEGADDGRRGPVVLPLGQPPFSPSVLTVNLSLPSLASSHVQNTGNTGL